MLIKLYISNGFICYDVTYKNKRSIGYRDLFKCLQDQFDFDIWQQLKIVSLLPKDYNSNYYRINEFNLKENDITV